MKLNVQVHYRIEIQPQYEIRDSLWERQKAILYGSSAAEPSAFIACKILIELQRSTFLLVFFIHINHKQKQSRHPSFTLAILML